MINIFSWYCVCFVCHKGRFIVSVTARIKMTVHRTQNSSYCVFAIIISQLPIGFVVGFALTTLNTSAPAVDVFIRDSYLKRYGSALTEDLAILILTLAQSLLIWGSFVGALLVKPCLQQFSRKGSILLVHALNVFSTILIGPVAKYGMSYESLIIGRFISGLSRGLGFSIIMLYVAETTCRRRLGFFQSPFSVVIFVSSAIGAALGHSKVLGTPELWHWQQFMGILPSLPYFACYMWIPNTPVYLMKNGKEEQAMETLKKLRDGDRVKEELDIIKGEIDEQSNASATPLKTILKTPHLRMQFFAAVAVASSPQLGAIQAILLYSDELLRKAGVDSEHVTFVTIAIFLQSIVAFAIFVPTQRKFGTKRVFVAGLLLVTLGLITIILAMSLNSSIAEMSYVAIVSMCIVVFGLQFGPQLTMMSLPAEMTTADTRPTTAFYSGCSFWLIGSIVSLVVPYSISAWGGFAYLPFAIICAALLPFSIVAIPETHKRSAAEIQKSFRKKSSQSLLKLFTESSSISEDKKCNEWNANNGTHHKLEAVGSMRKVSEGVENPSFVL